MDIDGFINEVIALWFPYRYWFIQLGLIQVIYFLLKWKHYMWRELWQCLACGFAVLIIADMPQLPGFYETIRIWTYWINVVVSIMSGIFWLGFLLSHKKVEVFFIGKRNAALEGKIRNLLSNNQEYNIYLIVLTLQRDDPRLSQKQIIHAVLYLVEDKELTVRRSGLLYFVKKNSAGDGTDRTGV